MPYLLPGRQAPRLVSRINGMPVEWDSKRGIRQLDRPRSGGARKPPSNRRSPWKFRPESGLYCGSVADSAELTSVAA